MKKETSKDNKCVAVVAMNLAWVFGVGYLVLFKLVEKEGDFNPAEFLLLDLVGICKASLIWCACAGYNPLKMFPWKKKWSLILRSFASCSAFFLQIWAVSRVPVSIVMVCFQTYPFWVSLLGRVWLKEPIMWLELLGMLICFGMVGTIAS